MSFILRYNDRKKIGFSTLIEVSSSVFTQVGTRGGGLFHSCRLSMCIFLLSVGST